MQGLAGFFKNVIKPSITGAAKSDMEPVTQNATMKDKGENSHPIQSDNKPDEKDRESLDGDLITMREMVYDLIKDIRDPEKPQTLEELEVVCEDNVHVKRFNTDEFLVKIVFVPTVPHCSLASLIGLCMRQKLQLSLPDRHKLDIFIKEGTHETADEINKQINDKERIAAALENPNLRDLVTQCISEEG